MFIATLKNENIMQVKIFNINTT